MNKILLILSLIALPIVAYTSFETVTTTTEAKTLTVQTPSGKSTYDVPNETPNLELEARVPQDMNWSVSTTPKSKPTYVHKAKKAKTVKKVNQSNDWFNIKLPEVKF